jgi:hypothetical protein
MNTPETTVLVGVINRKRDFLIAQDQHWYRIPEKSAPRGVEVGVLAFFLSGSPFKEQSGGIHYYAHRRGVELALRRDLLPDQPNHKRADERYYKVQIGPLQPKLPPILNKPNPIAISFIYTTWDRFQAAETIRDLYSQADYFVDRVFHALRQNGLSPQREWECVYPRGAQIRILCENGSVTAGTSPEPELPSDDHIYIPPSVYADWGTPIVTYVQEIEKHVRGHGGPQTIDLPVSFR